MAQLVKNMPATGDTWVQSLGWEDPLEKGKATHCGILAWRIPQTVKSLRSQSRTWLSNFHFHFTFTWMYNVYFFFSPHVPRFDLKFLFCSRISSRIPHYMEKLYLPRLSEKAMAPHSSTLAWKIPWMEEPGGLQFMGSLRVRHDWETSLSRIGEGNGKPLQCSCQENPRHCGVWWVAVSGVA